MATYQSSSTLQTLRPSTVKSVTFATSAVESIPSEQRWWVNKFHLGPAYQVRSLPNYHQSSSTSSTHADFYTPSADRSIVSAIAFGGPSNSMAIACGPRVCLYGGSPSTSLSRALARGRGKKSEMKASAQDPENDSNYAPIDNHSNIPPDRMIGTGGIPAYCAAYREDGRLLVVGCANGRVLICDTQSRAILRTFSTAVEGKGKNDGMGSSMGMEKNRMSSSTFPVRAVGWLPKLGNAMRGSNRICWSAGDDAILRLWDISGSSTTSSSSATQSARGENEPLLTLWGHGDAIRSCDCFFHDDGRMFLVSASLDHSIRLWDISPNNDDTVNPYVMGDHRCLAVMDHGCPVQCLLVIHPLDKNSKQNPVILSAGGTWIKLWDPMNGSCIATVPTKHSKTITSVSMITITRDDIEEDENGQQEKKKVCSRRLLTAGLDGLIRIHAADDILPRDTETGNQNILLPYLHGVKFSKPISALAVSPDCNRVVVGFSDGLVTVRQKAKTVLQGIKRKSQPSIPRAGTYSYFMRGANVPADADDHIVQAQKKKKLQKFDEYLKKFRYSDALDEALLARDPNAVLAVLEELGRRRGLKIALSNRDEETLEPILSFTVNFISSPRYTALLIGVANILCDFYGSIIGQSEVIDELFEKLRRNVQGESSIQKILLQLLGQIDTVMYAAQEQPDDNVI